MTPIAPLITSFLREHMPIEQGYSPHTCEHFERFIALLASHVTLVLVLAKCAVVKGLQTGQEDINAACSPRGHALGDRLVPDGRLPAAAAPTLDTQREER